MQIFRRKQNDQVLTVGNYQLSIIHYKLLTVFLLFFSITLIAQQKSETYHYQMEYLVYTPENYATDTVDFPLVIFLHGIGERGDSVNLVKMHGPPMLAEKQAFPFVLVSPQCPSNQYWEPKTLNRLLDKLLLEYRINPDRVYLTGLSMGGYGTWAWALENPERFAAIAPVCGGSDTKNAWRIRHLPTRIFHGGKDKVVPVSFSVNMHNELQKYGNNSELTIYPNASHNSWSETYNNPELYDWLMKQSRELPEISLPKSELKKYVGKYKTNAGVVVLVKLENNELVVHIENTAYKLTAERKNQFYSGHPSENMFTFETTKEGKLRLTAKFAFERILNYNKTMEAYR